MLFYHGDIHYTLIFTILILILILKSMSFYLTPYDSYREIDIPNDTNSITIHYGKHKDIINVILHIILYVQRGLIKKMGGGEKK